MNRIAAMVTVMALSSAGAMIGCKGDKSPAVDQGSKETTTPSPTAPSPTPTDKSAPPLAKVDQVAARAVLDRWLAAQNQGDFDAYQACYATKVDGYKRIGPRLESFDRAGWLADRKRMFKKKMTVEMSDLELSTTSTTARARFTQKWASGKYEDLGPKEILLVREAGELRIAREEMLESKVLNAPKGTLVPQDGFLFVEGLDDGDYVVLGDADGIPHGKPKLVSDHHIYVTRAPVADRDLPAEVLAWRGREVASGDCRARVVGFTLFDQVVPHWSSVVEWRGETEDGEKFHAPASKEQIAEDAFGSAIRIGGKLEGSCDPGRYVRAVEQPAWLDAEPVEDADLGARVVTAFRKLPAYRETQAQYVQEVSERKEARWEEFASDGIKVYPFRHPKTGKVIVLAGAHGGYGCGMFAGELWAVFQVGDQDKLSVVNPNLELYPGGPPIAAIDLEGDGQLEWVLAVTHPPESWLLVRSNGQQLREHSVAYRDCDC